MIQNLEKEEAVPIVHQTLTMRSHIRGPVPTPLTIQPSTALPAGPARAAAQAPALEAAAWPVEGARAGPALRCHRLSGRESPSCSERLPRRLRWELGQPLPLDSPAPVPTISSWFPPPMSTGTEGEGNTKARTPCSLVHMKLQTPPRLH